MTLSNEQHCCVVLHRPIYSKTNKRVNPYPAHNLQDSDAQAFNASFLEQDKPYSCLYVFI